MTRAAPGKDAKRNGPPAANQSRAATVTPGSYNSEARTFNVVLSTFADVKRWGMIEQLSSDPGSWDLSRVALGQVKLLDSHNQGGIGAVLGTLTDARFESGQLVGTVQLGVSEAARAAEPDIASGHLRGVSIGYAVGQWTLISSGEGGDVWRADKITLMEASLVSVPADAGAMIRSTATRGDLDGDRSIDPPRRQTLSQRDTRDLQRLSEPFNLRGYVDELIDAGDLTRREICDRLCAKAAANQEADTGWLRGPRPQPDYDLIGSRSLEDFSENWTRTHMHANAQTLDNPQFLRQALEDALYARMTGKPPEGAARQFMGARLADFDDILAERDGERRSWISRGPGRWFGGSRGAGHSTSDFPNLLLGAGNRVLQEAYEQAQSPLLMLGRQRQAPDFRAVNVLRLSEAPELKEVTEGGEVTYGSRGEEAEAFRVKTFARIFAITRQALVNDDLSAFVDRLPAFARAAAQTTAAEMVALFTANTGNGVNLADGNALFTTARGNKAASGAAIDVDTLGAARQALRETKGIDGKTPIGLTPRYLVVGPAKETEAEQAISQIMANQVSNANPFAGKLEVLVEPRFTGNAWRVFADPSQQAVISYAYLNGRSGPILETREGWETLGAEFRAILDFGCGATDWRGAYLNPGD